MTHVILVCRMSSSRLPGKTLMDFGDHSLLSHIISRIETAGVDKSNIIVCTSEAADDAAILDDAAQLGCQNFAGSLSNVSQRILDAACEYGLEDFCLILGDNPWIDSGQIQRLQDVAQAGASRWDYLVTATPELIFKPEDERYYPIGTRVQYIRTAYMQARLAELDNDDVREHTSKLFSHMPNGTRCAVMYPDDGWALDEVAKINISINTVQDYENALAALTTVGDPLCPTRRVVSVI